jgi:hypothetical protein
VTTPLTTALTTTWPKEEVTGEEGGELEDVGGLESEDVKDCGERGIGEKARASGGKECGRSGVSVGGRGGARGEVAEVEWGGGRGRRAWNRGGASACTTCQREADQGWVGVSCTSSWAVRGWGSLGLLPLATLGPRRRHPTGYARASLVHSCND